MIFIYTLRIYEGWFFEIGGGIGGLTGGVDIGINQNEYHVPTGLSGVNEAQIGVGTPGVSGMMCYYMFDPALSNIPYDVYRSWSENHNNNFAF